MDEFSERIFRHGDLVRVRGHSGTWRINNRGGWGDVLFPGYVLAFLVGEFGERTGHYTVEKPQDVSLMEDGT